MIYIPILGALLEGIGAILDKKILKIKNIDFRNFTTFGFLAIVLVMIVPLFLFSGTFWKISQEAFLAKNLLIFLIVIACSVIANVLMCYGLKRETVTELEPIRLIQPLLTIIIAFILSFFFFSYENENNLAVLIPALIASIALVASHIKKHHFVYNKHILAAFGGSLFFAIELVISKSILQYYSSFTFYFLRCFFIFLIAYAIFRPKINSFPKKAIWMIFLVSIIWVIYRVILYWGYENYGVVFTTMLFILSPVFIYIFARIFLKEKLTKRNIISSIIIVICVVFAIYPKLYLWIFELPRWIIG